MLIPHESEVEDFVQIAKRYGYEKDEFHITSTDDTFPTAQSIGPFSHKGTVTVHSKRNGAERRYKAGVLARSETCWPAESEKDLKAGVFG